MKTLKSRALTVLLALMMVVGSFSFSLPSYAEDNETNWYDNLSTVVIEEEDPLGLTTYLYYYDFNSEDMSLRYSYGENLYGIFPLIEFDNALNSFIPREGSTTWTFLDSDGEPLDFELQYDDDFYWEQYDNLYSAIYETEDDEDEDEDEDEDDEMPFFYAYEQGENGVEFTIKVKPSSQSDEDEEEGDIEGDDEGDGDDEEQGEAIETTFTIYIDRPEYMKDDYAYEGEGTEESPYLIENAMQLQRFETLLIHPHTGSDVKDESYYLQTADIDMLGAESWPLGQLYYSSGIFGTQYLFAGTYDGGNHKIKNLHLRGEHGVALFGGIEGATIKNVIIDESCSFTGKQYVAGVVGYAKGENLIENCINYAPVHADTYNGNAYAAGILGYTADNRNETAIIGCKNYGDITTVTGGTLFSGTGFSGGAYAAGITGSSNWPIVNCANYGNVTGGVNIGGIAGQARIVLACSNTGDISSSTTGTNNKDYGATGGIVGKLSANKNGSDASTYCEGCYNTGSVSSDYPGIGGLIGYANNGAVNNCYQVGNISCSYTNYRGYPESAPPYAGQLIGYLESGSADNVFYISRGSLKDYGEKKNSTALSEECPADWMRSDELLSKLQAYNTAALTFASWEADSDSKNGGYPVITGTSSKLNYKKDITSAKVGNVPMKIDEDALTATAYLPYGTVDLSRAEVTLDISSDATVSPASGSNVDFSRGPVTFTVTAEDGTTKEYTFSVHQAESETGLAYLSLDMAPNSDYGKIKTAKAVVSPGNFNQNTLNYSASFKESDIIGEANNFKVQAILAAASGPSELDYTLNGTSGTISKVTDLTKNQQSISYEGKLRSGENILTISAGDTVYTIKIYVKPCLSDFALSDGNNTYTLTESGSFEIPADMESGTINFTSSTLADDPSVTINGGTGRELSLSELDCIEVKVGTEPYQSVYNIPLVRSSVCKATFTVNPSDAVFTLTDKNGQTVSANSDGSYTLISADGYSYTCRAVKAGYITAEKTLTATDLNASEKNFTVTLLKAGTGEGESLFPAMVGDWISFRGTPENNGVTSAETAISIDHVELAWTAKVGTGYNYAPTPPMLINGYLYTHIGRTLNKIDPATGEIVASADVMGASNYTTNPIACGAGMIFTLIDTNRGGMIQAFDADTLTSLWVSEPVYGQVISPLTYHDGYLYTGTWRSEVADGYYFCLTVTDEDTTRTDEVKQPLWKLEHKGGYYWAGAYATDKYVIFGSDDGLNGWEGVNATLYSVNPLTGNIISKIDGLTGDIRSAIAYDNGKIYFTSKAGYLYQVSVDENGNLSDCKSFKMKGMATGTPVVHNGIVYSTSLNGTDQFNSHGAVYAVSTGNMSEIAEGETRGYNQASLLLSTAYEDEGKIYLYGSYNREPGGLEVMVYDTQARSITVSDFFVPGSGMRQYGICSPICDANGTIYYKNDSGTIFALKNSSVENKERADRAVAEAVEGQISAIGEVTLSKESAIKAAREAYDALTDARKALVSNLSVLVAAENRLNELKNSSSSAGEVTDKKIHVTMRLIGAELAEKDVDLGAEAYMPNYVTWIPTKRFELDEDATVYDLFMAATEAAGIKSYGANNNYVASIWAPSGYELSEFTNGYRSGWMYTVNGSHPGEGLKYWSLNDGDKVIWHYVNDYSYEVEDWFDEPQWPKLGDGTYWNRWLMAPDRSGAVGGGVGVPGADPINTGDATTNTEEQVNKPIEKPAVVETVKVEAAVDSKGVAKAEVASKDVSAAVKSATETKADAIVIAPEIKGEAKEVKVNLPKAAVNEIAEKTTASLVIETKTASVEVPTAVLNEIAAQAGGASVEISVALKTADTAEVKEAIAVMGDKIGSDVVTENAAVAEITVVSGNEKITTFGGKSINASVSVDGKKGFAEGKKYLTLVISENGKKELLAGKCTLDASGKLTVGVEVGHLSTFVVLDKELKSFADADAHWSAKAVDFAVANGLMNGISDTAFDPNATLNRAMLVTVLYRMSGSQAVTTEKAFDDVAAGQWYSDAVAWAAENGIVTGKTDTSFAPMDNITREQFATMLMRYCSYAGLDAAKRAELGKFTDNDAVSPYANEALSWANANGIITGRTETTIAPKGNATRGEAATMLMRFMQL